MKIFVFGSNLAGRHGRGAAKDARIHYGAQYGVGIGRTGNAYAIPTKDWRLRVLPIYTIAEHVDAFRTYATQHHELTFNVTRVGCGLAGYKDHEIAPLFHHMPVNVELPALWEVYIKDLGLNTIRR